jgi:hypothetical protein
MPGQKPPSSKRLQFVLGDVRKKINASLNRMGILGFFYISRKAKECS